MSRRWIGTPLRTATTRSAKSSALCRASLAVTATVVWPSLRKPCGEVTLAALSALRNWSGDSPIAFIARRLRSTRTAGVALPATSTEATPCSWRRRCARIESAWL